MKKKGLKNKKIIVIIAVVLVAAVAAALVFPVLLSKDGSNYMYGNATVSKEKNMLQHDISFGNEFKYLYDTADSIFAISSADGANIFQSHSRAAADNSLATIVDIRLRDKKGNSYSMDSTANCISKDACQVASQDDSSLNVIYKLTPKDNNNVYATIGVLFELVQGSLKVSVDASAIDVPDGFFVEKLSISAKNSGHRIKLDVNMSSPVCFGEPDAIEQVITNIISNAIKYTPAGGKIDVTCYGDFSKAYICVRDNGIGIPESDLARIFERFYRVDKARSRQSGGTGLGLAIAREIILRHNGTIEIESPNQKGTIVKITLPLYEQESDNK